LVVTWKRGWTKCHELLIRVSRVRVP